MVKRAETVRSTSASGVQSCAQVNIDLRSALSLWPVASLMGSRHVIPDLARLSLRKLAPRRGRCQHCAVRPERLDAELISMDLTRRRRRAGKAGGESAARHR